VQSIPIIRVGQDNIATGEQDMLRCFKCGYVGDTPFCPQCGERLAPVCTHCGQHVSSEDKWCSHCGQALSTSSENDGSDTAASPGFSFGDVGMFKGNIDPSTHSHVTTTIGSQVNVTGPLQVQVAGGPAAEELFSRGLAACDNRMREKKGGAQA
jgi:RNA polymerase subunit RPABC4/transcription elongation factor Spt4